MRGCPDIIRINRHIASASPELVGEMAKIGVQVEVADANEKSLPASLRSAQDSSRWLLRQHDGNDQSLAESIQALCHYAQADHDFRVRDSHSGVDSRDMKDKIQQWLALPVRGSVSTATHGLDWVLGPWMSSWETSLPPDQPRYFHRDGFYGNTWLLTGKKSPEDIVDDENFWTDSHYDNAGEIAKNLIACWPNPLAEVARCAGTTQRELQWFTSGKASLDQHVRFDLEALLGIELDKSIGRYVEVGPYVLVANKPLALKEVYEGISCGGDACACEIVPRQGAADPSWRYVLIKTYGESPSIVMAPRGEKITERLPELIRHYDGIRTVAPKFYQDVVSTCARACRKPDVNIREMKNFVKRHEDLWTDCLWCSE
ncbi:MAG: hypothetical protein Tsb002_35510 [Wenzhouxiangellaceae bacterium]